MPTRSAVRKAVPVQGRTECADGDGLWSGNLVPTKKLERKLGSVQRAMEQSPKVQETHLLDQEVNSSR